ncbi:hypothetical protein BT96DRAFT_996073 [Gymnopus androsaceus JB14]|uniref:E3 ubiquitin-protein ligase listerin n=1 Tax=Gymnopus androsaceus JB14 TaxID=1447944 RepID=A0A6A4HHU0_9AGAR|nr:hypothetical protein BT96DRAFT_996073 [Gymnopus androsaceus JB14]
MTHAEWSFGGPEYFCLSTGVDAPLQFIRGYVKVRMSYIEQLRSSGIIEAHFIPNIFALLSLDNGIVKAFKLDIWAVDKFYVQFLIRAELDHVKRSTEGQSELAPSNSGEDNSSQLTVKVASGAVNKVTALYSVDKQQLEIRLRNPSDWPLHRVEIRDTKKIGVDDNRWRAWILGVQQTIWA